MSLSSVRIVARITGGFTSCLPLGRLVGHLWDSWHFLSAGQTDTQTRTHTSPRPLSLSLSLLFFPLLVGLENFSRRYFFPHPEEVVALRQPRLSTPANGGSEKQQSPATKTLSSLEETGLTRVPSYSSVG